MSRDRLLGIDVGTQSVRVALLDLAGRVVSIAGTPQDMRIDRPGWAAQDPDAWWAAVVSGTRRVLAEGGTSPEDVLAVGVGAQMHAAVPVDRAGRLLSHAVALWCDKRATGTVADFVGRGAGPLATRLAANPPLPAWVGFKMRWLADEEPELFRAATWFVTGSAYINLRLTGEVAVDLSEASGFYLMDALRLRWSSELAELLGVSIDQLPEIRRSTDVIGRVTRESAGLTGLREGTPVVTGAGDMPCMLLAAGLAEPGQAVDISGTASDLCVYAERPVVDPPTQNLHHAVDGWVPFGIAESGGGSVRWIRDRLAGDLVAAARSTGVDPYALMEREAQEVPPGAGGLLFLPYLLGERILGSSLSRGALIGITPETSIGAITRAAMEGVCFELRRTLDVARHAGVEVQRVSTTGGGARSAVWSQAKADIYELPVQTIDATEGGVVGSAMLAAVGAGVFASPRDAVAAWVRRGPVYLPRPEHLATYRALYGIFTDVHDRLQEPFEGLARLPGGSA